MSHSIKSFATRIGTSVALVLLTLVVAFSQPVRTSPAGATPVGAVAAVEQDAPTSVTFSVLTTCASNNTMTLKVGAVTAGSLSGGADCTCGPPVRTFTTSAPTVLAAVGAPACSNFSVKQDAGNWYLVRASVSVTRPSGVEA